MPAVHMIGLLVLLAFGPWTVIVAHRGQLTERRWWLPTCLTCFVRALGRVAVAGRRTTEHLEQYSVRGGRLWGSDSYLKLELSRGSIRRS